METAETFGIDPADVKSFVFRLAHFNPTCTDEYDHQVIDYLLLDTLASFGQLGITAREIKEHIKKCFRLDFDEIEINASGVRLYKKNMINYSEGERDERPILKILVETEQQIKRNLSSTQELERYVLQDWKDELCSKYKDHKCIENNIERIVENLQSFITKMFIKHGVESVALLYPEAPETQNWLSSMESTIREDLPKIDIFTDAILTIEIPRFFNNTEPKRKSYITSLFNSSFFWHLIQVDEKCSKLFQNITKGQRLYIDNNILYNLVGFNGDLMLHSSHKMLEHANSLGYELWITTKTVDEFKESVTWRMFNHKQEIPLPQELVKIALDNLEVDSYLTSYWRDYAESGLSIEEFTLDKTHIDKILETLSITVTEEYRTEIENSNELKEEESKLRLVAKYEINEHIINHDAFHRVFINKIRRGNKYRFSDAVAWFLTNDRKLPVYDRHARRGRNHLPFCITSDQWMQVNRPLLTRTINQEEYEQSFYVLVTQPLLRSMIQTVKLEEAYEKVLGQLNRYKNMTPQLALLAVTDKHFMVSIALDEENCDTAQKIDNRIVDIAKSLETENESLEKHSYTQKMEIRDLKGKIDILGNEIVKQKEKISEIDEGLRNEKDNRVRVENKFKNERTKREKLARELSEEQRNRENAESIARNIIRKYQLILRWSVFSISLILLSFFIWFHDRLFVWTWLDTHKNRIVLEISSQLLIIFSLLFIVVPLKHKFWKGVPIVLVIVIAILSFTL
jgi:hypothetical protein